VVQPFLGQQLDSWLGFSAAWRKIRAGPQTAMAIILLGRGLQPQLLAWL
jgi:hypothetical protein